MKILISLSASRRREHFEAAFALLGAQIQCDYLPCYRSCFDALILAGGGDVCPLAGEDPELFFQVDEKRDEREQALLFAFLAEKKPVLGICRGHQLIARCLGGRLIAHLPGAALHQGEEDVFHGVRVEKESFLSSLYGSFALVNSAHHQGVGDTGGGMKGVAFSQDGLCEAAEHLFLPVRSVQWHPERLGDRETFFENFLHWVKKERKSSCGS